MTSDEARKKKQARTNRYRSANREAYNEYIREYRKSKAKGQTPKPLSVFIAKHGGDVSPKAKRMRKVKGAMKGMGLIDTATEVLEDAGANPLPPVGTASPMREQFLSNRAFAVEERDGLFRAVHAPVDMPKDQKMDFRQAVAEANRLNAEKEGK